MRRLKVALVIAALIFATPTSPLGQLGGEFKQTIADGYLLYMQSALPGISPVEAATLRRQAYRMIKAGPEVTQCSASRWRGECNRSRSTGAHNYCDGNTPTFL